MKWFMQTMIPQFLPGYVEISEAEGSMAMRRLFLTEKKLVCCHFLRGAPDDSAENFIAGSLFSHSHPSAKFRPNPSSCNVQNHRREVVMTRYQDFNFDSISIRY